MINQEAMAAVLVIQEVVVEQEAVVKQEAVVEQGVVVDIVMDQTDINLTSSDFN